ncbi:MAG: DUF4157 domain-containing protein [Pyrinomonadaceae bacterium]
MSLKPDTGSNNSPVAGSFLSPSILRQASCPCGGGCPACQAKSSDLKISQPNDPAEIEADQIAERVMRMSVDDTNPKSNLSHEPNAIHRKCDDCEDEEEKVPETVQRKQAFSSAMPMPPAGTPHSISDVISSGGQPLDHQARSFFEPRLGYDLSTVRIHTDPAAEQSARAINAKAYTLGNNIVFGSGEYNPENESGKYLLAHELAHVRQQQEGASSAIQRYCSDETFCTPYATDEEAESAEWWIRNTYFRLEGYETYGPEVKGLYESYLDRSPGDSLDPVIFDSEGSYIVRSFQSSWDTKDDHDAVIDLVGSRLSWAPAGSLRDDVQTHMSLSNFLSQSEMDNRPINYSNPLSVAGHIAGGLGSSDAGDDYRKVTLGTVTLERVTQFGSPWYTKVDVTLQYEVFDAIDFCPGDCGSPAEQLITVPMSRLEASGMAYDVPFKVIFTSEERTKRFWS